MLCIVLKEILDINHAKPFFLLSFTEYPSSPSLYICRWWTRRHWGLDVMPMYFGRIADMFWISVLYCLQDYASRLMFLLFWHMSAWEAFWSRCILYLISLLYLSCKTCKDAWCTLFHWTYARLSWTIQFYIYFAFALVSPIFHTLIVCDFCKSAFGNLGLLAITAPNYLGRFGGVTEWYQSTRSL